MAEIVVGKKEIWRPIRLETRRIESFFCQFVFIGINQIGLAMVLEPFHILKKGIRLEQIIMIKKSQSTPLPPESVRDWRQQRFRLVFPISLRQSANHVPSDHAASGSFPASRIHHRPE